MIESQDSINNRLHRAGYGHERMSDTDNTGKHRVFRLSDGKTVGEMPAHEVVEFLESLSFCMICGGPAPCEAHIYRWSAP